MSDNARSPEGYKPTAPLQYALVDNDVVRRGVHGAIANVTAGGAVDVTLPAAESIPAGWQVYVRQNGAGAVTITPAGGETFTGGTAAVATAGAGEAGEMILVTRNDAADADEWSAQLLGAAT